jgi:hypothetical protein
MQLRPVWLALALIACGDDSSSDDTADDAADDTSNDVGDDSEHDGPTDADADADVVIEPDATPDADTRDIAIRLNDLPGVTAQEYSCQFTSNARCFLMTFTQDVDHTVSGGPTFEQHATLTHVDLARPFVALTSGYMDFYGDYRDELAEILNGNQISIEHRFFNQSRPEPADWTKLTIAQMAADQHHIAELLKPIYTGAWLATGGSKGGMTASYWRRFYPDDVVATVPYVAPLSHGQGDERYNTFLDARPQTCRDKLRALQVELLTQARFDAMVQRATAEGDDYNFVAVGPAVEAGITALEFAFWQYQDVSACSDIPATTATNATLWAFLNEVAAPSDNNDDNVIAFAPYYYQAVYELGYPSSTSAHLVGLTRYNGDEYAGVYPAGVELPTFRGAAMLDVENWVRNEGERLLFIYGEHDPWTAARYPAAPTDSLSLTMPAGNHGSGIYGLEPADQAAALAKLEAWTGVPPNAFALTARAWLPKPKPPRIPTALLRAR